MAKTMMHRGSFVRHQSAERRVTMDAAAKYTTQSIIQKHCSTRRKTMKLVQTAKMALVSALVVSSMLGQPSLAQAEGTGGGDGGGGDILVFDILGVADGSTVEGDLAAADSEEQVNTVDPEWKYVPVRR
jgi:hypothetical protein